MARNVVKPTDLMIDSPWTFVAANGTRKLYFYDRIIIAAGPNPKEGEPGFDAMHALRNPATGKCASVTEKWLREGPVANGRHPYWLVGDQTQANELANAA